MLLTDLNQTRHYKVADACYMEMYHTSAPILNQFNINQLINFCINDFDKGNNNTELYYYDKPLQKYHHYLQWAIMGRIEQGISSIHFKLITTAHFDIINQIKDREQACKQVKHNIETPVILLISSISSEPSALFASDLIPITFIV